ncbi:hypothetical protein HHK36_000355 [Tetracentron sinense]|uniref:Uncharacterized protein n=1 Tax=Tetracentron sinense TaxID=13715 RepID=A0A834ZS18_TETSI|nr:hypothetical protein HHK36_000355 [Tetracentron sinense]
MVMYTLASLLHSFDWVSPEGAKLDLSEKFGIVLKKATPLVAVPMPSLSDPAFYVGAEHWLKDQGATALLFGGDGEQKGVMGDGLNMRDGNGGLLGCLGVRYAIREFFSIGDNNKLTVPLLGYLPFLDFDLHRSFAKLAHIYGHIMKLPLVNKLCVVPSPAALAKEALRDQDIATSAISNGGADIAWSSYGPNWDICCADMSVRC